MEDRKVYVREPTVPFVSMAEMMKRFESKTRDRNLILEASTLPALPRRIPQLPEFQEFHLKTTERTNQNAGTLTVVSSTESTCQNQGKPLNRLSEPKIPLLQTSLRARPPKVKSSQELEQEELEKDSPPPTAVTDLFEKLSWNSDPCHNHQIPRIMMPDPFLLHTEAQGAEKERKFVMEVLQKQWEEEKARIPKATPYPCTTDYPVIPPKPEPKNCTRTQPEPFQLESLVRHEEEMQSEMEERQRRKKTRR